MRTLVGLASVVSVVGLASVQVGTLDQVSPFAAPIGGQTSIFNVDATFLIWNAQVRAGISGQLEGVTLGLAQNLGGSGTLRLRSGSAAAPGPVLATASMLHTIPSNEFVFYDFTSAGLMLNAGDTYVLELQGDGNGLWVVGTYVPPPAMPYYPEPLHLNGAPHADGNWRIGFETYMLTGGGCPADLTGSSDPNDPAYGQPDGMADAADFFYYLDQFVAANLAVADLSGSSDPNDPLYGVPDGVIDAADFFYYLDLFVSGCP